jgi:hypothetical protein
METKKILKKQRKAEQKLKDRQQKEAATTKLPVEEVESEEEEVDVKATIEESKDDVKLPESGEEVKKDGDKYFSQLEFKDLPFSEQTHKAIQELGFSKCTEI